MIGGCTHACIMQAHPPEALPARAVLMRGTWSPEVAAQLCQGGLWGVHRLPSQDPKPDVYMTSGLCMSDLTQQPTRGPKVQTPGLTKTARLWL